MTPEDRRDREDTASLSPEALVRLRVNGRDVAMWTCTPTALRMLAAGWLVCEGVVLSPEEIVELREDDSSSTSEMPTVSVRLTPAAGERLDEILAGGRRSSLWPTALTVPAAADVVRDAGDGTAVRDLLEDGDRLRVMFREMFDAATLRATAGGVHTGGLVKNGLLRGVVEDVSRHHVVDRLAGIAVLGGRMPRDGVFLLSSRISGAMVVKACRAGAAALISRSIPSTLAASLARGCGLVLVGRARRRSAQVHWPA